MPKPIVFGIIIFFIVQTNAQWITPSPTLPRSGYGQVTAVWNDKIYLYSGSGSSTSNFQQLLKYSVTSDHFIDYGSDALDLSSTSGWGGEVHGQIHNLLYLPSLVKTYIPWIYVFNLSSSDATRIRQTLAGPPYIDGHSGCLAATDGYLFMVGGYDDAGSQPEYTVLSTVLRYDIGFATWEEPTHMNIGRMNHA